MTQQETGPGKHCCQRAPHTPPADTDEKLIIHLRDISHMMRKQFEGKMSQKRILIILNASGMLTQKELTQRLGIQPGSASEILSKLENAALITRTPNAVDRRTTDIQLTDAGAELAAAAAQQRRKRHAEMFSCLSPEEKETLLSLLEKIHTDWEIRFGKHPGHGHRSAQGRHGEPRRSGHSRRGE